MLQYLPCTQDNDIHALYVYTLETEIYAKV